MNFQIHVFFFNSEMKPQNLLIKETLIMCNSVKLYKQDKSDTEIGKSRLNKGETIPIL